jgi:hypothetical protein
MDDGSEDDFTYDIWVSLGILGTPLCSVPPNPIM